MPSTHFTSDILEVAWYIHYLLGTGLTIYVARKVPRERVPASLSLLGHGKPRECKALLLRCKFNMLNQL